MDNQTTTHRGVEIGSKRGSIAGGSWKRPISFGDISVLLGMGPSTDLDGVDFKGVETGADDLEGVRPRGGIGYSEGWMGPMKSWSLCSSAVQPQQVQPARSAVAAALGSEHTAFMLSNKSSVRPALSNIIPKNSMYSHVGATIDSGAVMKDTKYQSELLRGKDLHRLL
jgi:hypothetical protein